MRKDINAIVRQYAVLHNNDFEGAWNLLYRLYNGIAHKNIKLRARRRNIKPLDMIEQLQDLALLKQIAVYRFNYAR